MIVALGILGYMTTINSSFLTLERLLVLFEPGYGDSAGLRAYYFTSSLDLWLENPIFGYGIGSWPLIMGLGDTRAYPHNMILEIAVELGLVGLVALGSVIIMSLRTLGSLRHVGDNAPLRVIVAMMFVNTFVNSMVSGDVSDNRVLFVVLGLMVFATSKRVLSVRL